MTWDAPAAVGANLAPVYDLLRSGLPNDFSAVAICVESDDGADRMATDASDPAPGELYHYLVRAENDCPTGPGDLGDDSAGLERPGRSCP